MTLPITSNVSPGAVVPIPNLLLSESKVRPVLEDKIWKAVVEVALILVKPATWRVVEGAVVPMPSRLFVLSQKRLALFWVKEVPLKKIIEPEVKAVLVLVPPREMGKTPDQPMVWEAEAEVMVTLVSLTKVWVPAVSPFKELIPVPDTVSHEKYGAVPVAVRTLPAVEEAKAAMLLAALM
jgi:hypothetical protein